MDNFKTKVVYINSCIDRIILEPLKKKNDNLHHSKIYFSNWRIFSIIEKKLPIIEKKKQVIIHIFRLGKALEDYDQKMFNICKKCLNVLFNRMFWWFGLFFNYCCLLENFPRAHQGRTDG